MVGAVILSAAVVIAAIGYSIHAITRVGCPGCGGSTGSVVSVSGSIAVPNPYGVSQLTIQVKNTANDPIWTIEVTNSSGLPGSAYIAFYHNTVIISAANALSVNQTATGSTSVRNVTAGTMYSIGIRFILSTGATLNQTLLVTADS
jgi:hypothetical protein